MATKFDEGATLADRFRAHAGDNQHLYAHAMRGMADDWEAGGPVRKVCAGYENAPIGSVLQLRLLAGVFRLVLTGRAEELKPFYPAVGGDRDPSLAWPLIREVIGEHVDELHAALSIAPQTNEIGRSAALLAGIFDLVERTGNERIRILELGASAGLNLLIGHCHFSGVDPSGADWSWGPADSPVQLVKALEGEVCVREFEMISARGCDLHPVDATTPEGRLMLTSFVWPFDVHRHQRLAGALELAAAHPPVVDRSSASDWLDEQFAALESDGTLPVVWHSITQMYWPEAEVEKVTAILDRYGRDHLLGEVAMEFAKVSVSPKPTLSTRLWQPGAAPTESTLGTVHEHGIPVRLT